MISSNRVSGNTDIGSLPSLDDFRAAAAHGPEVMIGRDGSQLRVLAQGSTPSQRSVAWVEPDSNVDASSIFIDALSRSFSSGIQSAVVRELGLAPAPNRPLSSRQVEQAIDMAETAQRAMSGVDFLTQLDCKAASNGGSFQRACSELGIPTGDVGALQRRNIDQAMTRQFHEAAEQGRSPVEAATALQWLKQAIASQFG
ncbi:hypothetical protein G7048_09485 [Diaphorobacter sp. HDW4B]|uniref:hypothetical protein n=1 Tax=Diaphorobacter sp. HDW4B TaxID=2714925 RepID=UPI0014094A86|nr:hypothetical protein [Diaphorobacter sp. HDW4B]QIL70566.1 hypothetical protein G7048_09485 [Diaphorobacter sp. HDW4B]